MFKAVMAALCLFISMPAQANSLVSLVPVSRGESIVQPRNGAEHTFTERLAIVSGIAGVWSDTCADRWRSSAKDGDSDHPALAAVADEVKALKKAGQLPKNFYELASAQYLNATNRTDTCSWIERHFPAIVRYSAKKPVNPLQSSYHDAKNDECKSADILCQLTQIEFDMLVIYCLIIFLMCWVLMRYGIEFLSWNMRKSDRA